MCNNHEERPVKKIENLGDMDSLEIGAELKCILTEAFHQGASVTLSLAADWKTVTSADVHVQGYHWKSSSYMPDGQLSAKFGRGFSMS